MGAPAGEIKVLRTHRLQRRLEIAVKIEPIREVPDEGRGLDRDLRPCHTPGSDERLQGVFHALSKAARYAAPPRPGQKNRGESRHLLSTPSPSNTRSVAYSSSAARA